GGAGRDPQPHGRRERGADRGRAADDDGRPGRRAGRHPRDRAGGRPGLPRCRGGTRLASGRVGARHRRRRRPPRLDRRAHRRRQRRRRDGVGVAAGLAALRAIVEAEVELGGEAMLVTVPGEEDGGAGMLAAIRAGCTGDWAVITEPTRLEIVTAQGGAITFTLTVTGRPAHAAFRRRGVSALEKLVPVMEALARNEEERNAAERMQSMRDLGLPYPTSIGRVSAGDWSSTVPERLVAEGRFGVRVGQTTAEAEEELRAVVAAACAGDEWLRDHPVEVQITGGRFAAAAVPSDHPLPWALGEAARDVRGRLPPFVGVPYGSDARLLIDHGATPTVLYGPGDPEYAHSIDERVPLEDVAQCARVLAVWVMRALQPAG